MRHLARGCVALCTIACGPAGLAEAQQRRPQPITDTADRIARETWPVERGQPEDQGLTIFRTETEGDADAFKLPPPWLDDQPLGPRMNGSAAHRERLMLVTPEAFRGSVLYPAGVSIDPGSIVNGVKSAWRRWQEQRVRERIQEEVNSLKAESSAQGN